MVALDEAELKGVFQRILCSPGAEPMRLTQLPLIAFQGYEGGKIQL